MPFLLLLAGAIGGALNSVAGGGSFIVLPALLFAGVPPVAANATTTMALWPGSIASAVAYRSYTARSGAALWPLLGASLAGGLLGGLLLIRTSNEGFMRLLPWLMLVAALTFTFSGAISARWGSRVGRIPPWSGWVLQLAIATYGGYFGGGMGIVMLAVMSIAGMSDIHEMNGVKAILGVIINGVALATFIAFDAVAWRPGLVMAAGAMAAGYAGAIVARRAEPRHVRSVVVAIAWLLTAYFFLARD